MKKIDNHFCRSFGNDNTHLRLTDKADRFYSQSDPLNIWEREDEDADGSTVYLYTVRGIIDTPNCWMSENELNEILEELSDQLAEETAENYFWTLESWGADYPPENADEIISKANEMIVEFAKTGNGEDAIEDYSATLWERFCSTGKI